MHQVVVQWNENCLTKEKSCQPREQLEMETNAKPHFANPTPATPVREFLLQHRKIQCIAETAKMIVADIQGAGGLITMEDLKKFKVSLEMPVLSPGSGALVSAVLDISAGYILDPVDKYKPILWHRLLEACKYVFAMRSHLGDWSDTNFHNDVREVVGNLTSQVCWEQTRAKISETETVDDPAHYGAEFQQIEDGRTSHISIVSLAGRPFYIYY